MLALAAIWVVGCAAMDEGVKDGAVFYPPLPQTPRLQFLVGIGNEDDLGGGQNALDRFLFGKIPSSRELGRSYDIGASPGKIYVLDRLYKKIVVLDLESKKFDDLKDEGAGRLMDPSGIWVTPDDTKYVADMGRRQILVFDKQNRFLQAYGGEALFEKPVDVAVFQNRVYVCDMDKHRVLVLDRSSGNLLGTVGRPGGEEGKFHKPTHVFVDTEGNLFVNDAFNYRVQKFDPKGYFLRRFGQQGDAPGSFARPKGLAADGEGNLYVADAAFENVQVFDAATGRLLLFFGGSGSSPGSMYLPAGVHIDDRNLEYFDRYADPDFRLEYLLYVANTFGDDKLNVYGFGRWEGPTPQDKRLARIEKENDRKTTR
jgi:sugar lactone lactonase YvrE